MNRKITCISIAAVLMLVTISYATALNTTDVEKKASPLFKIRTNRAITEKISSIIENIKKCRISLRLIFPQNRLKRPKKNLAVGNFSLRSERRRWLLK